MSTIAPPVPATRTFFRWWALGLLFLIYTMNLADRQIVGILAENIKRELALSDTQIGLLAGPAISFFYALLGVPMAFAADRTNRVRFIAVCVFLWSIFTALGGRATNLLQLAATRIGVSVAEAGGTPCSVSLIADFFRPSKRATAMAIYTSGGSSIALFVAFALGGYVNQEYGWRTTLLIAGIPGVILGLVLVLTVREPVRGVSDDAPVSAPAEVSGFRGTIAFLWRIRIFRQGIIASIFTNVCTYGIVAWAPPFAERTFSVGTAEVGGLLGTGIALIGGTAMIVAGIVTDRLARRGLSRALTLFAGTLSLAFVLMTAAMFSGSFLAFGIALSAGYAMVLTYSPIIWLILQTHAPPNMRATATAVMLLMINLIAAVPTPLLIGMASDRFRPMLGDRSLQFALLAVPIAAGCAAIQFLRMAATARRMEQADRDAAGVVA